jgi:hypothetical protein
VLEFDEFRRHAEIGQCRDQYRKRC